LDVMGFVRRVRRVCDDSLVTHWGPSCSTATPSRYALPLLRGGDGELEGLGLRFVGRNRDGGRLRAQPLLPGGDLVGAWIETRDRELPVCARHRKEGMREDADVRAHPGMNGALDVEHRLRFG